MDLREIECFIAVADELHFGRAARRLHLAQPTVSECIRRLERHIGGRLFDRSTRAVALTELGSSFLEEAREAYGRMETAYERVRTMAGCPAHALSVGAMAGDEDLVVAATAAFTRVLPAISVQFEEMHTVDQIEAVAHGRIDAGVAWEPAERPDIALHMLGRAGYVAVVPQQHSLARRSMVTVDRLADEPLITWSRATNPGLYEWFVRMMSESRRPWSLVAAPSGVGNLMARVISGQGVGVVPSTAMIGRRLHGISLVPVAQNGAGPVCALISSRRTANVALSTFAKAIQCAWTECRSDPPSERQLG
jgi:DNA-binding transcriptional LysR family regulator